MFSRLALFVVMIGMLFQQASSAGRPENAATRLPQLLLWAWERPEDLRALPDDVGVAFLAQSVHVAPNGLRIAGRRQPLRASATAILVAVTRIDTDPVVAPEARRRLVPDIADAIARTARLPKVGGVQVDFDARASERPFYRELLEAIRARVGAMPLSITALASWCGDDPWVDGLPVDEAVPMLFRLGPVNEPFRRFATTGKWKAIRCRGSVGTSIDEPESLGLSANRVYVFSPRSWSSEAISHVRERYDP